MSKFKIIPVIDILNSIAVHAIKGERTEYKPLRSYLFQSPNPVEIIQIIKNKFEIQEFYVADLDSIIKKTPNFQILKQILDISDIEILLDPGIMDLEDIYHFSRFKIKNLIIGLETVKNFEVINQSLEILNKNNIIISLDMYNGQILSSAKDIKDQEPLKLIKKIESLGIKNLILLDLFRVGQKIGGIPSLYLDILHNFMGNVFVGGGIKNYTDILDYKVHKFSGVLIATALYDGTIDIKKLRNLH
ncbi:MAG: HisA/HisF-related TIM barrel protein [Candidatus Hodarchaeota archaeon]